MTLTLKSNSAPLAAQVARLRRCFRLLRNRRDSKPLFRGGIYFIEITYNERTEQWHPHLHVICEGKFVHFSKVRDDWYAITQDSYIVDVRAIKSSRHAAGYVSKYAGKPVPSSIVLNPARLLECVLAFHGARVFHVFGNWTDLGLSKPPAAAGIWEPYQPLASVIIRARNGDSEARLILSILKRSNAHEPMDTDPTSRASPLLPGMHCGSSA